MTAWLFQAFVGSTILGIVVMALRPWVLRRFGPRMAYGLWLLPVLRLALPALPVWTVHSPAVAAFGHEATDVVTAISPQTSTTVALPGADVLAAILVGLWAAGAIAHVSWGVFAYLRFVQRAEAARVGAERNIDGVAVRTSAFVAGPVAAGVWRRRIFVPLDFEIRFDADQQSLALAHERAHHRRHDVAWNFVALVMVSIHWFNPLAHRAYRLYRLDQELACDRDVVSAAPASRQAYGRLLAKASWTGGAIPVCALGRADLIKQRLVALTRPAGLSAGQAMACLTPVALAALLATAPFSVTGIDATASAVSAAILPEAARVPPSDPVSASGSEGSSRRLRDLTRPRSSPTQRPAAPVGDAEELFTAPVLAVEDRTSADYLARRRKAGLLRSRPRLEDPARTARERGRPIFTSSSPEP